jgi:hypothetical protein
MTKRASPLASAPRSSHVSVYNHNGAVKATHILDLGVPVAPALLQAQQQQSASSPRPQEIDALGRRPNGYWGSQNGGVKVEVGVRGREAAAISPLEREYLDDAGKKGEERVRIVATSQNGGVKCSVVRGATQVVSIQKDLLISWCLALSAGRALAGIDALYGARDVAERHGRARAAQVVPRPAHARNLERIRPTFGRRQGALHPAR